MNGEFKNNIIRNNNAYSGDQLLAIDDTTHIDYNNIEGGWPGIGNIDADPLFADPDNNDYRLTWANYPVDDFTKSPCIDTGDPSSPLDPDSTRADMGAFFYDRLSATDDDIPALPRLLKIIQNYPNPFNASTKISYVLPQTGNIKLSIYNLLGQHVTTLFDGTQSAGVHSQNWDASACPSGLYFARLTTAKEIQNIKMMLMK